MTARRPTRKASSEAPSPADRPLGRSLVRALSALASGFVAHPDNTPLRAALASGALSPDALHHELVNLALRLVFLLVAEARGLLHPPDAPPAARARYARSHSVQRLRARSLRPATRGRADALWGRLTGVFRGLAAGDDALALPGLGGLFDATHCPTLDPSTLADRDLLHGLRALLWRDGSAGTTPVDWRLVAPEGLGDAYEHLLALTPEVSPDGQGISFQPGEARKARGGYYTPDALVHALLDGALEPVIAETLAAGPADPVAALLALTVVDPACGSGNLLLGAARRLAGHIVRCAVDDADAYPRALRQVVGRCLYGVDLDPTAIELCKVVLWLEAAEPARPLSSFDARLRCGDALLGATPELMAAGVPDAAWEPRAGDDPEVARSLRRRNRTERRRDPDGSLSPRDPWRVADLWCSAFVWPKVIGALGDCAPTHAVWRRACVGERAPLAEATARALAAQHRFFHWHLAFPEVHARGGFDVVLGNPPFLNAIEGGARHALPHMLKALAPDLHGAADVAYRMLARAAQLRRPDGRVGMIQPRGFLNAPSMAQWRATLSPGGVAMLFPLGDSGLFPGAQVFVALVVLAQTPRCRIGAGSSPADVVWRSRAVDSDNWWAVATGDTSSLEVGGAPLRERFSVAASMTTGDAYDVAPCVVSRALGDELKLVTTGLIDPDALLWGVVRCRYLKQDYQHPRVVPTADLSRSLTRRLLAARRPKLLVAGLSARVEVCLDPSGACIGAVSTYTITHPSDDIAALRALMLQLHAPESQQHFRNDLGGNAMGGGNITMKRSWLESFRVR